MKPRWGSRLCGREVFRSHPAELADARVGGLPQPLGLHRRLPEEEKHLVVVGVFALRNPEGADELWFWKEIGSGWGVLFARDWLTRSRARTVQPARVVLLGADGRASPHAPEDGEISPHQVCGHTRIQLVTWETH